MKLVSVEETKKPLCEADVPPKKEVVEEMLKIMHDNNGIGLAAPQVGYYQRMFVMQLNSKRRYVCCNPKLYIPPDAKTYWHEEGCLSKPGTTRPVKRYEKVRLRGFNEDGQPFDWGCMGKFAAVVQHEMDHLAGKCIFDEEEKADGPKEQGFEGENGVVGEV